MHLPNATHNAALILGILAILPRPHLALPQPIHQEEEQGEGERGRNATGHQSNAKVCAPVAELVIEADHFAAVVAAAHRLEGLALAEGLAQHHLAGLGQSTVADAQPAGVRPGHIVHASLVQLSIEVPAMATWDEARAHRVSI